MCEKKDFIRKQMTKLKLKQIKNFDLGVGNKNQLQNTKQDRFGYKVVHTQTSIYI